MAKHSSSSDERSWFLRPYGLSCATQALLYGTLAEVLWHSDGTYAWAMGTLAVYRGSELVREAGKEIAQSYRKFKETPFDYKEAKLAAEHSQAFLYGTIISGIGTWQKWPSNKAAGAALAVSTLYCLKNYVHETMKVLCRPDAPSGPAPQQKIEQLRL